MSGELLTLAMCASKAFPVVRVLRRKSSHPDAFRVTHRPEPGIQIRVLYRAGPRSAAVTGGPDRWIRLTATGRVALIAGTVSYLHMHMLVELYGQPGWGAALTPFSVDGMIVAASTTLLVDSRSGSRGGILPWTRS